MRLGSPNQRLSQPTRPRKLSFGVRQALLLTGMLASMALSWGCSGVAHASGSYTFSGLAKGTYTVTPSHTGYTFSPASNNVTINAANVPGVNFTATVQQAHSVALSWIASTSAVAGYNVYRSTVSGTQYTKVNSSLVGGLAYTDGTVLGGTLYYFVTTAVDASGNESAHSNEVSANVP